MAPRIDLHAIIATGGAAAAAIVTRRALMRVWEHQRGEAPPRNPDDPQVNWRDAIVWGALSGMLIGIARVGGRRAASGAMRRMRQKRLDDDEPDYDVSGDEL